MQEANVQWTFEGSAPGKFIGALFVISDSDVAYDMITTFDLDYRDSGASVLLVYDIIKYLSENERAYVSNEW